MLRNRARLIGLAIMTVLLFSIMAVPVMADAPVDKGGSDHISSVCTPIMFTPATVSVSKSTRFGSNPQNVVSTREPIVLGQRGGHFTGRVINCDHTTYINGLISEVVEIE